MCQGKGTHSIDAVANCTCSLLTTGLRSPPPRLTRSLLRRRTEQERAPHGRVARRSLKSASQAADALTNSCPSNIGFPWAHLFLLLQPDLLGLPRVSPGRSPASVIYLADVRAATLCPPDSSKGPKSTGLQQRPQIHSVPSKLS